jgi:hypothetical protein
MSTVDYSSSLMPTCKGCTDVYAIPFSGPPKCTDDGNRGPTLIPDKIEEFCNPEKETRLCISCGSRNIDSDGICLDCASIKNFPTAPDLKLHRLIPQFRAMSIFSQYSDKDCYGDFDINYLFELGEGCLSPCQYTCSFDYVLLLFVAHKLELALIQSAESTGRFAVVTDNKLPKRPTPLFNQGASGTQYDSEFQMTMWGLQLIQYRYSSPAITMFGI